jgi:hypothetical protein
MTTGKRFAVEFYEDKLTRTEDGQIKHHPLNGLRTGRGTERPSYGHLTFCGHNMDKSPLFDDVRVYQLWFHDDEQDDHFEEWAHPLRIKLLENLCERLSLTWYIGIRGAVYEENEKSLLEAIPETYINEPLSFTIVRSEGSSDGFSPKLFFNLPKYLIPSFVNQYWLSAFPGVPIEGYLMESNRITQLMHWDSQPRDDLLFRDVMDKVLLAFYTIPSEQRSFAFVTSKREPEQLARLINLEGLQTQAAELERAQSDTVE